ncbi:hypothetical protein NHX12_004146 [Muraenolepis orangiensis]|uniref:Uncharacterized protein n=1 Tax=Muraenolepis orangiensis TaxID=630683 RepID=A0A9Q0DW72_9TELE|nr:hypothetical protein NHX12_004146 [Muraenolepis orangiensis]
MITRNLTLLVLLCLMEGLSSRASANRNLRRRGAKLGESREADQWDAILGGGGGVDETSSLVVTLRNVINRDQEAEGGSISYAKMLQSHAVASSGNKETPGLKPKCEVEFFENKQEVSHVSPGANRESTRDAKRVRNDTKCNETAATKTGKVEKAFMIHYRNYPHSDNNNKTSRVRSGPSFRTKPACEHVAVGGVPATGFGVLKLLSKENLVRIVNSQLQSFQSEKGGGWLRQEERLDRRDQRSFRGRPSPETGFDRHSVTPDQIMTHRRVFILVRILLAKLLRRKMEEEDVVPWGPRSRSRRSWIWNQFFVIEEYAGPKPVLIGRPHRRRAGPEPNTAGTL